MFAAFGELGCCEYWWRWLPEGFSDAWAAADSAPEMALILTRLGFDWDEVVTPAKVVEDHLGDALKWRTPESAFNAVLRLCDLLPEAESLVCQDYREKYPTELVAEKFLEFLQNKG